MPSNPTLPGALRVTSVLVLATATLHAHRPFEITSVARLQHGRLEFTVIISPTLGNLLVRDPAAPEAPGLDATSIDFYRERLLKKAAGFYEVRDGDSVLKPTRIYVEINKTHEPEFTFIYPAPVAGPLRVRVCELVATGPGASNFVCVYDDKEQVLGGNLLIPGHSDSQLVVPLAKMNFPTPAPPIPKTDP